MRIERLNAPLEIKAVGGEGAIEGYGSVYGNLDLGLDVMAKGAFGDSLERRRGEGRTLPMLWQHDAADPVGVWEEYSEDDRGLRVKGRMFVETTRGRDAYAFAKGGAVEGLSVGYVVKDFDLDRESGVRTIRRADLWEVSLATFPMNPEARIDGVKFVDAVAEMTAREIERHLRDAGLSARDAKAAVSRLMDLGAQRDAARIREAVETEAAAERLLRILKT